MAHIKLDFDAYRHNLLYLSKYCGGIERLIAVFKDNAYGHGLSQIAPLAAAAGVRLGAVKNCDEAHQIDGLFETILILADLPIEPAPSSWAFAIHSIKALQNIPSKTRVHVNIDTGMHRNGIFLNELEDAIRLCANNQLKLEAFFTHYHSADVLSSDFFVQKERFEALKPQARRLAKKYGYENLQFHASNSAALLRESDKKFLDDYARSGIATYGYTDLPLSLGEHDLRPVLSLWAKKMSSRKIEKGDCVGYGATYEALSSMTISTYDIGYGDGLFRYNGKGILQVANGKRFLGRVSMDSFSIECVDDEVCVFNDAREFAKFFDTITYDILAKLLFPPSFWALSRACLARFLSVSMVSSSIKVLIP
jgi:alanine racemase